MNENKKFVQKENTRKEDQKNVYNKIEGEGHCPFCEENLLTYHKLPIIKTGKYWTLTNNQWPYDKIKNQLLAVYKTHIEHIQEMDPEAGKELIELFSEECKKRNIPGGGIAMRFGSNPELGTYGSSVLHLHAHLIEPDLGALKSDEAWKFKFGQPKNYKKAESKIIDNGQKKV
jgi:diadenosine tetraphosphate (Ap4A) HIT family hydrolase